MEETLPPGFRFHPTDEELITYYLAHKVSDSGFTSKAVAVVDLNKCEPWELPDKASMGEKEWYFFSMKDRKYPTGLRTNRATEAGYWKTTGKDKEIFRAGVLVGMKKTLVFYKGRAPRGEKSNWVMHEYRLENKHPFKHSKEEWVVCRVFQKSTAVKKPQQAPSSREPSVESPCDTNSIANEFGDIELPTLTSSSSLNNFVNPNNINTIPTQGFMTNNNMMSLNNNMNNNWTNNSLPPLSSWPPNLLSPNLSMNSFLLKALQLRNISTNNYQPNTDLNYSYNMPQGVISHFGTDLLSGATNFQLGSSSSSSKNMMNSNPNVVDSASQQQPQEQPFNLDSVWS
ncbi:hypothetical protein TIFTF001_025846 [Ficus carica]|uniref:NAC domain-containing protein n=1 Tax=Ficus carica TaxID=3494 RepID=A0AA88AJQ5_FICCA|nr:hypothetical protein TIFTF001_025846 [Ficus carica]